MRAVAAVRMESGGDGLLQVARVSTIGLGIWAIKGL